MHGEVVSYSGGSFDLHIGVPLAVGGEVREHVPHRLLGGIDINGCFDCDAHETDPACVCKRPSQASNDLSRAARRLSGSASTGSPDQDSSVATRTPLRVCSKRHSWMPMMPCTGPDHRVRECSSTTWIVEVTVTSQLVQVKLLPVSNSPSIFAAVTSRFQDGQLLTSVCRCHTTSSGAAMSTWWCVTTGASRSMSVGVATSVSSLVMLVVEDVDPAVRLRHVDDTSAVNDHVFGLMDEFAWNRSGALFGVVWDVVGIDEWITGVAHVIDLEAGVEVREVHEPIVGCEAIQALLLVLVVWTGSTTLVDDAASAVRLRWTRWREDGHDHRIGFVGDVHRGDVIGGFGTSLLECLTVDDNDIAVDERHRRVHCDGAAKRGVYREGRDVLG